MLLIRDEQLVALRGVRQKEYEKRLAAHLKKYFFETCTKLGEQGLRDAVRYGIHRAKAYGIQAERDVVKYLRGDSCRNCLPIQKYNFSAPALPLMKRPWLHMRS